MPSLMGSHKVSWQHDTEELKRPVNQTLYLLIQILCIVRAVDTCHFAINNLQGLWSWNVIFHGVQSLEMPKFQSENQSQKQIILPGLDNFILHWKFQISFYKKIMPVSHVPNQSPVTLKNRTVKVTAWPGESVHGMEKHKQHVGGCVVLGTRKEVERRARFPLQRNLTHFIICPQKIKRQKWGMNSINPQEKFCCLLTHSLFHKKSYHLTDIINIVDGDFCWGIWGHKD